MRIGVLTTSFPERPGAVSGAFVYETARALVERGHEVHVVAPAPAASPPSPSWPPSLTVTWARYAVPRSAQRLCHGDGVPDNLRRHPARALLAPGLVASMAAEAARAASRWDGVVSHWLLPSGLVAAAVVRRPHVAVAHSADVWLLGALPAGKQLLGLVADRSTAVACVSPHLQSRLESLGGRLLASKTELLPLGPDSIPSAPPDAVSALRRRVATSRLVVAVLARLVPVKGVDVLLRALARPEARGIGALVAGDGPERPRLERLARRLGATVQFVGEVSPSGRAALLAAADALVVPSVRLRGGRTEGLPVAAVEGLAAGLPLVASRVGGLPWAASEGGIVVEPGSAESLAAALVRLRDDTGLRQRLGRKARRGAQRFGWDRAAARLESLLDGSPAGSGTERDRGSHGR